jgi:hypothetical protein
MLYSICALLLSACSTAHAILSTAVSDEIPCSLVGQGYRRIPVQGCLLEGERTYRLGRAGCSKDLDLFAESSTESSYQASLVDLLVLLEAKLVDIYSALRVYMPHLGVQITGRFREDSRAKIAQLVST